MYLSTSLVMPDVARRTLQRVVFLPSSQLYLFRFFFLHQTGQIMGKDSQSSRTRIQSRTSSFPPTPLSLTQDRSQVPTK